MTQDTTQAPSSSGAKRPHHNGALFRRIPLSNLQIILIALAVVGGRLIFDFSQRILEGQNKIAEQRDLETDIASLTQEQRQLEADKAYYSSPAYVEAWAHDQGKMVREGEILVIPAYDNYTQTGNTLTTSEPIRPLPRWHIWWSLFFDDPIPFNSGTDPLPEGMP